MSGESLTRPISPIKYTKKSKEDVRVLHTVIDQVLTEIQMETSPKVQCVAYVSRSNPGYRYNPLET